LAGAEARQPSQQFLQSKLKCNICYLKERFFYPQWMGKRYVPSLPAAAAEFFDELWSNPAVTPTGQTGFAGFFP
jgi:hypothetical protein